MLVVILIVAAVVGLSMIGWIVVRKAPQLASMNVEESPSERVRNLKKKIVAAKALRRLQALKKHAFSLEHWERARKTVGQALARLKMLEEKYKSSTTETKVQLLLNRAFQALADDPDGAEQYFLEVVTLEPHNLQAYEGLAQIYLAKRAFKEAQEVAQFLMKLNPASSGRYVFTLASAYGEAEDRKSAWKYATQAVSFEPANPKYLDFLTELAILEKRQREANKYLENLKAVNPENGKILDFEKRISELEN